MVIGILPLPGGKVKVYRREKAEELDALLLEWELDKLKSEACKPENLITSKPANLE